MLRTMVYDTDGKVSSKRLCGIGAFIASTYMMIYLLHNDQMDSSYFTIYVGAFAATMAAGVMEKRGNGMDSR